MVCQHTEWATGQILHRWSPSHNPFCPASCSISISSHRQRGLCWQGSIVRGERSWQRGDDVTAGCRVSNRHCSVGKLALSARGHPAGHREVFDELNSTRWLPLIQLGLPGWQFERKKGSRKPPEGLKNATEPSEESAVMRSKTCWMYGEGWLFYYWWPSKNVRLWLRHNKFVWELNAQSRLWKANTLCLFFFFCSLRLLFYWHPDVLASPRGF